MRDEPEPSAHLSSRQSRPRRDEKCAAPGGSSLIAGLASAAVAQAGGDSVDRQVNASLHQLGLVTTSPPSQQ